MTEPRWDLIHDAYVTENESEPAPETPQQHATTCDLLRGFGWHVDSTTTRTSPARTAHDRPQPSATPWPAKSHRTVPGGEVRGVRGPNTPRLIPRDFTKLYEIVDSGCWEWRGYIDVNGYGKGYDESRLTKAYDWAHRLSYARHKGEIPAGYEIDHICENTVCVNPDHLDAVTKVEHARRTMQRLGKDSKHERAAYLRQMRLTYAQIAEALGYSNKEGAHNAVKAAIAKGLVDPETCPPERMLSELERSEIRELHAWGFPQSVLSEMYRVDNSQISRIINGKSGHSKGAAA